MCGWHSVVLFHFCSQASLGYWPIALADQQLLFFFFFFFFFFFVHALHPFCRSLDPVQIPLLVIQSYTYVGWYGIGVGGAFLAVFTLVVWWFANRVAALRFRQERLEGDFRFAHIHVRHNAESFAFYRSSSFLQRGLDRLLALALANYRRWVDLVIRVLRWLLGGGCVRAVVGVSMSTTPLSSCFVAAVPCTRR